MKSHFCVDEGTGLVHTITLCVDEVTTLVHKITLCINEGVVGLVH